MAYNNLTSRSDVAALQKDMKKGERSMPIVTLLRGKGKGGKKK